MRHKRVPIVCQDAEPNHGIQGVSVPPMEDPTSTAETMLALLNEAILVGPRPRPDPEGIVWVT